MAAPKKRAQQGPEEDLFVIPSKARAASSDYIKLQDLDECLLVIRATSPEAHSMATDNGTTEYVEGQVLVVEGAAEMAGEWHDLWVFPVVIRRLIKDNYPNPVIGWLGHGEASKGRNAPWVLLDPEADDIAKCREAFLKAEIPF